MKKRGVIGVDVGGTSVSVGIITETAEVIEVIKYAQVHTKSSIWTEKLIEKIEELRQKNYQDVEIIAIGIGSRGHVDFVSQKLISSSVMEVEKNFDLCRILKERFEIPVYIDNDVKAAASGELFFGIGTKYRTFICYNVGTGIAAAVIQDGQLIRGKNNNAGEIGNDLLLKPELYGRYEGLEEIASGQGITAKAKKKTKYKTTKEIMEACRKKEKTACEIIDRAIYVLAASVINMNHLLEPDLFVFTGGVVSDDWFFETLKEKVAELSEILNENESIKMVRSEFIGKENGPYGPAGVAFYGMLHSTLLHQ